MAGIPRRVSAENEKNGKTFVNLKTNPNNNNNNNNNNKNKSIYYTNEWSIKNHHDQRDIKAIKERERKKEIRDREK